MLRLFRRQSKPAKTHDFTRRYWSRSIQISYSDTETETLYVYGHSTPRPKKDDVLLTKDKAGNEYHWRVATIEYYRDPSDMWYAGLKLLEDED